MAATPNQSPVNTIRIFLASSAELVDDREDFEIFLSRKSNLWLEQRNISLKLLIWEDYIDALSKTGLQDEYNKAIESCDIFVMLFWTKVGKYTDEEFETALKHFRKTGSPLIYTYFKDTPSSNPAEPSLEDFKKKLEGLKHFETVYKHTSDLLLHFSNQLDKLFAEKVPPAVSEQAKKMYSKQVVFDMINKDNIVDAFEELNNYFLGQNDSLNALMSEYINRPNSYSSADFRGRLKAFVIMQSQ